MSCFLKKGKGVMMCKSFSIGFCLLLLVSAPAVAQDAKKPNILILWGDDIGTTNISAYSDGLMG
jgi:hypothetical protein